MGCKDAGNAKAVKEQRPASVRTTLTLPTLALHVGKNLLVRLDE